jgi:hypothetical protein
MSNNSGRPLSRFIAGVRWLFCLKLQLALVFVTAFQPLFLSRHAVASFRLTNQSVSVPFTCIIDWNSFGSFDSGAIRIQVPQQPELDLSPYLPLRPGNFWTYRYGDGSIYTMRVVGGTKDICGVATRIVQDTDGFTQYLTNDSAGIRLHGQFHAPGGIAIVYDPPITLANRFQADNVTVTSSGTAQTPAGNYVYSSSFTTSFASVNVTVPLRTFRTITQTGTITIGGNTTSFSINLAKHVGIVREYQTPYVPEETIELVATNVKAPADYDGDGVSDIGIYRDGAWSVVGSSDGNVTHVGWGGPSWVPVGGDYDGDGIADVAVYHTSGVWSIIRSSDGGTTVIGWGGAPNDVPVPADYDGDGKTDIAIYRDGTWSIIRSSDGAITNVGWGGVAWQPVPADYDGDGKTDIAVYSSAGVWSIIRSSDGGNTMKGWGGPGWKPVPADYDGDGKADLAVYSSSGAWSIVRSSDGGNTVVGWGGPSWTPVVADYDGDGKADIAVYNSAGVWSIIRSSDGVNIVKGWGGAPQDIPLSTR